MGTTTRRHFLEMAFWMGASAAWGSAVPKASLTNWRERRDLYPEGVASGDPDKSSVLLWTRLAPTDSPAKALTVEVAEDELFRNVIATQTAAISAESDWTCRVLVGGLRPAHVYWYRFTDPN